MADEVLAIHVSINGKIDKDGDYAKDSRPIVQTGVLKTEHVSKWRSWRYLGELWFFRIWEKLGLDRLNPDVGAYRISRKLKLHQTAAGKFSDHNALLLMIAFLFNYWENQKLPYGHRALHLERLGCGLNLHANNLWTYCAETGCIPQTRSQVIDMLDSVQSESVRFFKKNPVALEELKLACTTTTKFILPESQRGS